MKRGILLGTVVGVGALSLAVAGFQGAPGGQRGRGPQGPPVAQIEKVKDNLYMITGGGGNTAAFITDGGVVLVDTKLPGWGQAIMDTVKTVTGKPVTMIVNTHTHGDHNGSNEFFGTTVEIVAHENTKANMEKMDAFKGDKSAFLPKRTYKDKLTVGQGKDRIDLYFFGPAHTSGDTWVVFPSLRVLHSGDAFAGKTTPIIDANNGGSAVNYGETVGRAATELKDIDTIVTGHSPTMTPADLKQYADFNNDFLTWVQAQIAAGKSVDQSAAEYKIPDKYPGYQVNTFLGGIKNNIQTAYNELGKK
jgi:glyoxylase-like metal-dependent hydrolase (beta-lactamase superfamily II)